MSLAQFWEDRQAEFTKYSKEYSDLKAHWRGAFGKWILWCGSTPSGQNVSQECESAFNAVARKSITELPDSGVTGDAEPWRRWLDFMRVRNFGFRVTGHTPCTEREWDAGVKDGKALAAVRLEQNYTTDDEWKKVYRRTERGKLQRLSAKELKGKSSAELRKYYHWIDDGDIELVFESSARLCQDLAARAFEAEKAGSGADARVGLRRNNYPFCYWLYAHCHDPVSDPKAELEYWKSHVWRGFHVLIESYEGMGMCLVDRRDNLNRAVGGLSFDLAVVQANYAIARGLRGEEAMQAFRDDAALLLEEVTSSWRASCERLAVTFEDDTEEVKNLAQPFHRVRDDLRRLLHELPATQSRHTAEESVKVLPKGNRRLPATVTSQTAVKRMEAYVQSNGIGQSEFAGRASTTDRTLRSFRRTGRVRRDIFDAIAKAMGTTREELLKPE